MMKRAMTTAILVFAGLCATASAEIVTAVKIDKAVSPLAASTPVDVRDFAGGSKEEMSRLLANKGYQLKLDKELGVSIAIRRFSIAVKNGADIKVLRPNDEDRNNTIQPASTYSGFDTAEIGKGGSVRGALDVDAGVIAQGAQLTGSGAGGVAIGAIGGIIGGFMDRAAKEKEDAKLPPNVAVLQGNIWDAKSKTAHKVLITAASTTESTPAELFDAALKQYVHIIEHGYTNEPAEPVEAAAEQTETAEVVNAAAQ